MDDNGDSNGTDAPASAVSFATLGLYGVPVTCVLLLDENSSSLLWGQGNWLHYYHSATDATTTTTSRIRVFSEAIPIHGMTRVPQQHTTESRALWVVHGGHRLAVVSLDQDEHKLQVHSQHTTVNDWIWTCRCSRNEVYVGTAHGRVHVFTLLDTELQVVRSHSPPGPPCILYSMDLLPTSDGTDCWVAGGTVTHSIEVWHTTHGPMQQQQAVRLVGHKGAIHRVAWQDADTLASIAEDRTVRVWERTTNNQWKLRWTGWGHAARGWNVAFHNNWLCSTGEDGTLRVWEMDTGTLVQTYQDNTKQSVWAVDASSGRMVVTGANDGSIRTHDDATTMEDRTIELPKSSNAIDPVKKHSIFAMQLVNQDSLIVGLRDGSLHAFDLATSNWARLRPWKDNAHATMIPDADPCSLAVHDGLHYRVAVGLKSGHVIVVMDDDTAAPPLLLDGSAHRSVQKLEWLTPSTTLVSFHATPGTIVLWTLSGQGVEQQQQQQQRRLLVSETNGLALCLTAVRKDAMVVVGDSRGHVSLHTNDTAFVLRRVHGREHVTHVEWEETTDSEATHTILSAGNDGCISRCAVTTEGNALIPLLSIPVAGISGITHVWRRGASTAVAGYHGNRFRIVDRMSGYEHLSIETGGRQRMLTAACEDLADVAPIVAVVTGGGSVRIVKNSGGNLTSDGNQYDTRCTLPRTVVQPVHSETIFDVASFFSSGKLYVVTGSEDCSSKISCFERSFALASESAQPSDQVTTIPLPPHTSGIRSVCYLCLPEVDMTLLVVASKIELHFYLMQNAATAEIFDQGSAVPPQKASIDQRTNCVAASLLPNQEGVMVLAGGSDGVCYVTTFAPSWGDVKRKPLCPVYRCERPILAVDMIAVEDHLLAVLGTSGGDAVLLILRGYSCGEVITESSVSVLLRCSPHSMGLNDISIRALSVGAQTELHLLSCGDDQSIYLAKVYVKPTHNDFQARLESQKSVACASRSALRGLRRVGDSHFVTVGYAGKVALWSYCDKSVRKVRELPVCVGDVNGLSCAKIHGTKETGYILAVGGTGVEFFLLRT